MSVIGSRVPLMTFIEISFFKQKSYQTFFFIPDFDCGTLHTLYKMSHRPEPKDLERLLLIVSIIIFRLRGNVSEKTMEFTLNSMAFYVLIFPKHW